MNTLSAHPGNRARRLVAATLLALALCSAANGADEGIAHVSHQVVDDAIVVSYELVSPRPCDVELWVLRANRPYRYKARSVTGDVGREVKPGQRRIHWQALEDLPELTGSGWIFEVRATRPQSRRGLYLAGGVATAVVAGVAVKTLGGSDTGTILITVSHPE